MKLVHHIIPSVPSLHKAYQIAATLFGLHRPATPAFAFDDRFADPP